MPGLYAPAQAIPATPPAHGLPTGAQEQTTPARWELGITTCPENCVEVGFWDPDCAAWDGEKPEKSEAPENQNCYDVLPFVVETAFKCDAQGWNVVDFAGRARRQLEAATPKAIEYELWTGDQKPTNPHLREGAVIINGGNPLPPKTALSMLGQALANCYHGGVGVLHAPTWIVDLWLDGGQIKEQGNRLVTIVRGDTIVAGSGYNGWGPSGEPELNQAWAFATGPVHYRLEEAKVFPDTFEEAFNHKTNDVEYRAERIALVNFDPCCHFGVLIEHVEAK